MADEKTAKYLVLKDFTIDKPYYKGQTIEVAVKVAKTLLTNKYIK
jgi:hypothetical protein